MKLEEEENKTQIFPAAVWMETVLVVNCVELSVTYRDDMIDWSGSPSSGGCRACRFPQCTVWCSGAFTEPAAITYILSLRGFQPMGSVDKNQCLDCIKKLWAAQRCLLWFDPTSASTYAFSFVMYVLHNLDYCIISSSVTRPNSDLQDQWPSGHRCCHKGQKRICWGGLLTYYTA